MKSSLLLGSLFLFLAVGLGAFGAHGLEKTLSEKYIQTFKTGVQYQYYHAFGLLFIGLISKQFENLNLQKVSLCFAIGILLFSFNCYIYALTQIKTFAMIVPLGGVLFMLGWAILFLKLRKELK